MTPSSPSRRSADLPPCDQRPGQVHRGEQAAAQRQRGLRLPDKAGPKTIDGIEHGIEVDPVAKSLRQARHREEGAREQPQRHDDEALDRSEEHTSELQSLMRNSYAVLRLKKKKTNKQYNTKDK